MNPTVRELFEDYRYKKREIERLKADKCLVTDSVTGSTPEAPYTQRKIKVEGVDQEKRLCNQILMERLMAECDYVESAVSFAPSSKIRIVLQLRYIDGLGWPDVLVESGMGTKSVDTVKKLAYGYLDSLEQGRIARAALAK